MVKVIVPVDPAVAFSPVASQVCPLFQMEVILARDAAVHAVAAENVDVWPRPISRIRQLGRVVVMAPVVRSACDACVPSAEWSNGVPVEAQPRKVWIWPLPVLRSEAQVGLVSELEVARFHRIHTWELVVAVWEMRVQPVCVPVSTDAAASELPKMRIPISPA
jgi:hypothetical protein